MLRSLGVKFSSFYGVVVLCTIVVVLCGVVATPMAWAFMGDSSSRLLFTAQITSPTKAAFLANWDSVYSIDSGRINITSFTQPTSSSSSGRVTFFISGDGRCSAMMGGRSMKAAGVVEHRGMLPMSSFAIPSSMSIPASWFPTTTKAPTTAGPTTATTTKAATLPPTGGSSAAGSGFSMPSGMSQLSMPSSAMGSSGGALPSGSMPSGFSMGSMSMPSGSMPSMPSMGSMSGGMSNNPCFPIGHIDMGLVGWQDVQLILQHQLTAQDLYTSLNITEMWTNATMPSGNTVPTAKYTYRLVADESSAMYPRVGRVEVQVGTNAMWGTVCFDTIPNSVALALCNTMFPGTSVANSYYSSGGRGFIAISTPYVHAGLVKGTFVHSPLVKNNMCTHKSDLGLVCGSNVTVDTMAAPDSVVSKFTYNFTSTSALTSTFPVALQAATSGSILASNVVVSSTKTWDGLSSFDVKTPFPFSQRDKEWIIQATSPWMFAKYGITHVMGSRMIVPRVLPAPPPPVYPRTPTVTMSRTRVPVPTSSTTTSGPTTTNKTTTTAPTVTNVTSAATTTVTPTTTTPTSKTTTTNATTSTAATTASTTTAPTTTTAPPTFKVTFEVGANISGTTLQSNLIAGGTGIVASDFAKSPQCAVGTTTTNAAGVVVKSCTAEFTSKAAAALAASEVMDGKVSDVFAASVDEGGEDEEEEDEGDNTIIIVAGIIVLIAVVGLVIGGVILYKRRSVPQGEAFSLDDHFEMNEAAMPLHVQEAPTKNDLVEL